MTEKVWAAVFGGVRGSRVLKIEYTRPDWKRPRLRTLEPIHVTSLGGEWYLIARRKGESALQHFALSRVQSAELLQERFEPPPFDPKEYFKDRFDRFVDRRGRVYPVVVRFSRAASLWALERPWHPRQQTRRHADGSATLSFPAPSLEEVKRWVLQWGAEAEVLRPKELRETLAKEARAMARRYRSAEPRYGGGS